MYNLVIGVEKAPIPRMAIVHEGGTRSEVSNMAFYFPTLPWARILCSWSKRGAMKKCCQSNSTNLGNATESRYRLRSVPDIIALYVVFMLLLRPLEGLCLPRSSLSCARFRALSRHHFILRQKDVALAVSQQEAISNFESDFQTIGDDPVTVEDLAWRVEKLRLEEHNTRRFLKASPRFLPYEECRRWVHSWGKWWQNEQDWNDWIAMGEKSNPYVPNSPDVYYGTKNQWISWEHFLGTERKSENNEETSTFE